MFSGGIEIEHWLKMNWSPKLSRLILLRGESVLCQSYHNSKLLRGIKIIKSIKTTWLSSFWRQINNITYAANIYWSPRRHEHVFSVIIFRLPILFQDVLPIRLQDMSSRRLQDMTRGRLSDVLETNWKESVSVSNKSKSVSGADPEIWKGGRGGVL